RGRAAGVCVRLDQRGGGGQPERGEQEAAEHVGGVVLAAVDAGEGDQDRHGDGGDEGQPAPPAAGVADDQDRGRDVETAGGGHVPGRIRPGWQGGVEAGGGT